MSWNTVIETFTPTQTQLLLGTLLGDGCISQTSNRAARYRMQHSSRQHEYNLEKYRILSEFCNKPPVIRKNSGYGKFLSVGATKSLPILLSLYTLIYPHRRKTVSKEWLSYLTPEGLAWWYLDDGSLAQHRQITLSTHSFPKTECKMLQTKLAEYDIKTALYFVKHKYWVISIPALGSGKFLKMIAPFIPTCMRYKQDWRPLFCPTCGKEVENPGHCGTTCRQKARKTAKALYAANPVNRQQKNQRKREQYHANLEKSRKIYAQQAREYRERNKERLPELRKKRWKKVKNDPRDRERRTAEASRYYQTIRNDPKRWAERKEKANQRRRLRQATDPEYRQRRIEQVRRWRRKQKQDSSLTP
jgi:hypothetical protein